MAEVASLAKLIDHTILKPAATNQEILKLCDEAVTYGFVSVCVNPVHVAPAAVRMAGSGVRVGTVIGFPLGATTTRVKVAEAVEAAMSGAEELDMVLNIGYIKEGREKDVHGDIAAVRSAVDDLKPGIILKVIIEAGLLTDVEIVRACHLAVAAGADYVKTSTGFGPGGATPGQVGLMHKTVGPGCGVKASGGIRTFKAVEELLAAGASRIGTSSGIAIMQQAASAI